MTVHVFLGPSLPVEQARAVLDAQYHPPVSCGDVTELVLDREPPKAIVLVDGLFEQVPTVWHKEILFALERGVRVFGAASMGALRAAELAAFGMEGVGGIYERFASGEYQDDDEVTIVHAPAEDGYVPLSEAMANLRAGLAAALAAGAVTAATHDLLVDAAKRRFYPDRSWGRLYADAKALGVAEEETAALRGYVREHRPDAKRADALAVLRHVAGLIDAGLEPPVVDFALEPTYYWEKLLTVVRQQRAERELHERLGAGPAEVYRHLAEHRPAVLRAALCDVLAAQESARLGLLLPEERTAHHRTVLDGTAVPEALRDGLAVREATAEALTGRLRASLAGPALARLERDGLAGPVAAALAAPDSPDTAAGTPAQGVPLPAGRRE
ncbi:MULTISPECIES: TfuA-like protein [Kitasatospora]|uniref:TfuA-like core domain-containing protein n=1 Tax=Kitasatospora arboriphila TaxID=258052 RepID=A0ABN1U5F9_9ACTN